MELSMRHIFSAALVAATAALSSNAFAADNMGMKATAPMAMTTAYRFELAGPIQSSAGKSIVPVRIVHTMDKKPVIGAIIVQSRADMGPIGMASMNAPIKALPVTTPGIYPFEIQNGSVWKKSDKWALTFAAKVQGETATVNGTVTVELKP
jgi:Cu(I)/Ag(I) efflux system membrane fusion protein